MGLVKVTELEVLLGTGLEAFAVRALHKGMSTNRQVLNSQNGCANGINMCRITGQRGYPRVPA